MTDRRFQPGDRVRSQIVTTGVAVGAQGTVQIESSTIGDLYQVLFDGQLRPHLMRDHELEAAAQTSPSPE